MRAREAETINHRRAHGGRDEGTVTHPKEEQVTVVCHALYSKGESNGMPAFVFVPSLELGMHNVMASISLVRNIYKEVTWKFRVKKA